MAGNQTQDHPGDELVYRTKHIAGRETGETCRRPLLQISALNNNPRRYQHGKAGKQCEDHHRTRRVMAQMVSWLSASHGTEVLDRLPRPIRKVSEPTVPATEERPNDSKRE